MMGVPDMTVFPITDEMRIIAKYEDKLKQLNRLWKIRQGYSKPLRGRDEHLSQKRSWKDFINPKTNHIASISKP